jgi:ankyrin repeat protein
MGALLACAGVGLGAADGNSRVADAVQRQNAAAVKALLGARADVNLRQGDGSTALHWAAHWDDRGTAGLLIKAGAQVNAATDQGITPLMLAALNGSLPFAEVLLNAGANPNLASSVGETALMTASQTGNVELVRLLLARGADVKAVESFRGQTALMRAVAENHVGVAQALLKGGADVSTRSKGGFTALMFAAQQGSLDATRLLVEAGASVHDTAPDGIAGDTQSRVAFKADTAAGVLMVAIDSAPERESSLRLRGGDTGAGDGNLDRMHQAHEAVALYLLDHGADPAQNGTGRTPLHAAVQRVMPALAKALIARGVNVDARLEKTLPLVSRSIGENPLIGATPFWMAAFYGDVEMMRLLAAAGADTRAAASNGTTPLMVASGLNFTEGQDNYGRRWFRSDVAPIQERALAAARLCLELGSDINAVNDKGETALHGAAFLGGTQMAPLLAGHGANLNAVNKRGQTAWSITQGDYHAVAFISHKETGDVLEKLGADTTVGRLDAPVAGRQR